MSGNEHNGDVEEWSLADFVETIRRNRRLVVGTPVITVVLTVVVMLVTPRVYESTATLMPQNADATRSRLAGLATQFGINLPQGDAGPSLAFYANLLQSREILGDAIRTSYAMGSQSDPPMATLIEIYHAKGRTDGQRFEDALKRLRKDLQVSIDQPSGLVDVSVRTERAALSQSVLQRILDLVNDFNLRRRQSQASAERVFVEGRMKSSEASLRQAQDSLQDFLQRNHEFSRSPTLSFEHDRLAGDVTLRQQIYTGLAQSYEQARIEEVRNTPVVTSVEQPNLPADPVSRGFVLKSLIAFFVGATIGVSVAFGRDLMGQGTETSGARAGDA